MRRTFLLTPVLLVLFATAPVLAGSHTWRVHEIFSDATGTLQFIELQECCGSPFETFVSGRIVESIATGQSFTFPSNLSGDTSNANILLATAGFAALSGAPTPDHIIPDNFLDPAGDTIWYSMAANYDSFTFGPGDLPTDGVQSIELTSFTPDTFVVGVNSPTNFAGETGSVGSQPGVDNVRGDCNADGMTNIADAVTLLGFLFPTGAPPSLTCQDACDANDDGSLNVADAIAALAALFGNPPVPLGEPSTCGPDPSADTLSCPAFPPCP